MPEGFFGMHRGKPAVYVIRKPDDPSVNRKHRLCFLIDSNDGIIYSKLIRESTELRSKLDYLTTLWKTTYICNPRDITFPLKRKEQRGLTKERYFQSKEMQNPILTNGKTIEYNGRELRSKNELIVCTNLDAWGYEYKVEIDLSPNHFTQLYPDATFYAPELEKPIAVETDGALDEPDYMDKSEKRKFNYLNNGFVEFKDIVFFRITDKSQFDSQRFKDLIRSAILCNLDDIIFPD